MDQGLSAEALAQAKARHGKNEFGSAENAFPLKVFLESFLTWRIIALTVATIILVAFFFSSTNSVTGHAIGIITAALAIHIVCACATAYRIRSRDVNINKLMGHSIRVIRQGKFEKCATEDIVPGDLLSFTAGDYIPADSRIIECDGLTIDESTLFGTEVAVEKISADMPDAALPPEKQKNMAFGGTYVVAGHGLAIVVKTGKQIEIWKQRQDARPTSRANTLAENETRELHTIIKIAGIVVGAIAVTIGWWFEYQNQVPDWQSVVLLGLLFILASAPDNVIGLLRLSFAKHAQKIIGKRGQVTQCPKPRKIESHHHFLCKRKRTRYHTRPHNLQPFR